MNINVKSKKIQNSFSRNLFLTIFMIVPITVTFVIYVRAEKRIDLANDMRLISFKLVDELHQSSDDLTRLARVYVITGETQYKKQYLEVQDIRNGTKPRPKSQETIPLPELMRKNGFTEQELAILSGVKTYSDELALLEIAAMKLAEATGSGAETQRARARMMLHDQHYHQVKAGMIKPIEDFFAIVDKRTQDSIDTADRLALVLRILLFTFDLWLVLMLWCTFRALRDILGGSLEELYSQIAKIGKGDFSAVIPLNDKQSVSIMGWLAETQVKLGEINRERKKSEIELIESTEKFRLLSQKHSKVFDSSPVGIATVIDRKITSVNRMFCSMMGYSEAELLNQSTLIFYPSREAYEDFGMESYPRLIEGKITHSETIFRRKDGSFFAVNITGGPINSADLSAVSIWIFEDISERKQLEEKLHKLSRAVEQSPVTIVITDLEGKIEFVNPKFTQLTGYSAEEAIGQNPRVLKSGKTPPELYQKLWSTISSGAVWEGEFLNRGKDGKLFWEHAMISPLRDQKGNITNYLAIKEDITEKKNMFEQLVQSQKVESIGQLAGGLAHDFNNILSVVSGYAYLMKLEMDKDSKQLLHLEQIMSASIKAAELTHSLLAYSRKQVMNLQSQNLNLLVTNVGAFITRLIGEHIKFTVTTQGAPLMVHVDSLQIEQVLMNLATNARDAMQGGGTFTITTSAGCIDQAHIAIHGYGDVGRYAIISVADSGCGMPVETVRRIFDPFFTTKGVGKGTGLGMAMVMGIIKQHNGFIDVQSDVGTGTVFHIYLPLVVGESIEITEENDLPIASGVGTILIAEDEPAVRDYMEMLLKKYGYEVIVAVDGLDAVDKYAEHKDEINLVILDMVMPRKSGKAAYNEIRLMGYATECLFISGYAADIVEKQGDLGEHAVLLTKPIKPNVLLDKIAEILNNQGGAV